MKKNPWYIVCLLVVTVAALADSGWAICPTNFKVIPADGTSGGFVDTVAAGSTVWYAQAFVKGHSYSVDAWDPFAPFSTYLTLALYDAPCSTALTTTDTSSFEPFLYERISWIQTTVNNLYFALANTDSSAHSYHIRVTDTTLVNPRWSTNPAVWRTQYAFVSVTDKNITGTLTVTDHTGTIQATQSILVPAGGEYVYTITSPSGTYGFSTFAFVGPPGAVRADAYLINTTTGLVVPSTFNPISEPR